MPNTEYADELCEPGSVQLGKDKDEEGRIERLRVKSTQQEEIRFSWWKSGRFMLRPLDLPEEDLLKLI